MKSLSDEQRDAAIDAANACYDSLYEAREHAHRLSRILLDGIDDYYLARDLNYHLRLAEQILADLSDRLEFYEDDEGDEDDAE